MFLEIGETQAAEVAKIAENVGVCAKAMVAKDLAGKNRVVFLKRQRGN